MLLKCGVATMSGRRAAVFHSNLGSTDKLRNFVGAPNKMSCTSQSDLWAEKVYYDASCVCKIVLVECNVLLLVKVLSRQMETI